MKLRCPRCESRIVVPDEWGGKMIRCKGCNKPFRVPRPATTIVPVKADAGIDMADLAQLERSSAELDAKEQAEAEEAAAARAAEVSEASAAETTRSCPHCGKEVRVKDPYAEVMCSYCWEPIPALVKGREVEVEKLVRRRPSGPGFYSGLVNAFTYPFGATGSLLAAAIAAIGIILLPIGLVVMIARAVEQGNVGIPGAAPATLVGVKNAVTAFFYIEFLFFAAVAIHAFLEVLRATAIGQDKPPGLVWSPRQWGNSITAYLALLAYYAIFALLAIWIANDGVLAVPTTAADFRHLLRPGIIGVFVFFTFFVPMHLIGIGVSSVFRGLNPINVGKSIIGTHVNYLFLVALVAAYITLYGMAFAAVLSWFGGRVRELSAAAGAGDVAELAGGLLSWGIVMGFGFYGVYLLGRIHGLFARTFRKDLAFDM